MNINCQIKLAEGAKMPTRAHDTDTGYDLYAREITIVDRRGNQYNLSELRSIAGDFSVLQIIIDTGVAICPPQGYAAIVAAQSRLARSGWTIANGIGVIDNGYRGTIKFVYARLHENIHPDYDLFGIGKKCGQLIFHKVETATFEQVDELPDTDRGDGGFGSTGTH